MEKKGDLIREKKVRQIRENLLPAVVTVIFLLTIGAIFYSHFEGWSYVDSFYFSTITLTTIGYGDLYPTTTVSKIFTSFYAVIGVGGMLFILSRIFSGYVVENEKKFIKRVRELRK
jgi:voltage-gated potassium channel